MLYPYALVLQETSEVKKIAGITKLRSFKSIGEKVKRVFLEKEDI